MFCSYWVPWHPRYQFSAYMPGDLFLAVFVAGMSTTFVGPPTLNPIVNSLIAIGTISFYVWSRREGAKQYTKGQLTSANKWWHDALYAWYAYLVLACFVAMWTGNGDAGIAAKVLITVLGAMWVVCVFSDDLVSEATKRSRFKYAHKPKLPGLATLAKREIDPSPDGK